MAITKIELENYRCYTKYTEDFTDGLNIIAGANGIGKTSVVEAVAYALFGNKMTRGKANDWIKEGKKHGKVKLHIDDFVIIRGDNEQLVEDQKGNVVARLNTGVDEWVQNKYGLSSDLFTTANYIAQKDIESFSSLQTAERIKRVEKLLRIDVLDKIKIQVKERIKELKAVVKTNKDALVDVSYDEDLLNSLQIEYDIQCEKLTSFQEEQKNLLIEKGRYEGQLKDWNTKQRLETEIQDIVYSDIPYTMEQLLEMKSNHSHNENVSEKVSKMEDVVPNNVSKELEESREEYSKIHAEYSLLENVKEVCPTCDQSIPNADTLIFKRDDLEKQLSELELKGQNLSRIQQKWDLLDSIVTVKENPSTVKQMLIDIDKLPYLTQYVEVKDVEKPVEINISDITTKVFDTRLSIDKLRTSIDKEIYQKSILDLFQKPLEKAEKELEISQKFVKFIDEYRKEFSQNVIPLIAKNAKIIFDHLTDSKFPSFKINKDYSIENYDKYSGSEGDSANFALRMSIAQVSRIQGFDTIILDEIAASFDAEKEQLLLDILNKTSQQLIYISHGDID